MNKISLIIQREYLSRVKKKSFILMTVLGPVLIAGLMVAVIWFGLQETEKQTILVVDDNKPVFSQLQNAPDIQFTYSDISLAQAQTLFFESSYTGILYLPENILASNAAKLYCKKQPGAIIQRRIEKQIESIIENHELKLHNIDREVYEKVNTSFNLTPYKLKESGGEEKVEEGIVWVGFIFGILIYIFIFYYGVQVMRGVIEEKTNRIIEVIISSVKPFQLMLGKIVGVALVGLTQFLLWIILTFSIVTIASATLLKDYYDPSEIISQQMTPNVMKDLQTDQGLANINFKDPNNIISRINFPLMLSMFLFYFIGGYLLYSALFAAIGSAVDNETDTQQFMLPVTLPLLLAYSISPILVENPEGPAAFWLSIVPFTSPIVMMVRIAIGVGQGGVPIWEVGLSMLLIIVGFLFTTWLAAKIYRTGILMYGKKISYKELWKWLKYNN